MMVMEVQEEGRARIRTKAWASTRAWARRREEAETFFSKYYGVIVAIILDG